MTQGLQPLVMWEHQKSLTAWYMDLVDEYQVKWEREPMDRSAR
jgi:hypothetical protein